MRHGLEMRGADYSATNLTDCTVLLLEALSALRLRRLERCTVVAGPVAGAVFLDGLRPPLLKLAAASCLSAQWYAYLAERILPV